MQIAPEGRGTGSWKWRVLSIEFEGLFWVQETNEGLNDGKDASLEDIREYIEEFVE